MQAKPQEEAREQEVIPVTRAQAADEIKKRGRDEERVKREAQSNPADDVRPVPNPCQNEGKESNAWSADFLPKQVNKWQGQKAQDGCAKFQAEERKTGAKKFRNEECPIHLKGFAPRVADEEDMRLSLRNIVDIQDLFGVVAERFRWHASCLVKTEEEYKCGRGNEQDRPA